VEELVKTIRESIFPLLYDRGAQQYDAGQVLEYGPVVISKGGIQIAKKNYTWTEIEHVSIQIWILKVSKISGGLFGGASAPAFIIPNLNALLKIIYQVHGFIVG
jgi:hypothetical protein